ncbi:MAG TPA: hypothetical protein P5149_02895 [Candidatus Competibacteraceae bacterium]|nr:hypothetical protein [Candidatus Competibacteraceae bacterium]MCP5132526.1 hypothetical protein [Gammaproteobacteria bacterium]HPF57856.1 hypothetical protein [Candidatus Competibacteraceae bacterium]HRY17327.1 hypothetical protein [Candidatus Competibacteraceae bacterium]
MLLKEFILWLIQSGVADPVEISTMANTSHHHKLPLYAQRYLAIGILTVI